MKMLILKIALTVAVFLAILTAAGGRFGPLELFVWLVVQIAVIAYFFMGYRKSRVGAGAHKH
ncbi:hypothetical protein ACF1G5_39940 [Streptomyces coeruleorubidus]|uniref:hypothetical protein n=1 Tax=Streptomyces coeruleorubidus TaxID=116188 RepID=UPI003701DE97